MQRALQPQPVQIEKRLEQHARLRHRTELQGLVYISGSLSTTTNLVVNGVLVCGGTLSTSSNLTTTYSNVFANNPPPGFGQAPKLLPMSGTWLQSVN